MRILKSAMLKQHLDSLFDEWDRDKTHRKNIHASDLLRSDNIEYDRDQRFCRRECVLKNFYEQNEVKNDKWAAKRFLNGWVLHEKWQDLFVKYSKALAVEEEIEHTDYGFKIVFTPDAIIEFLGEKYIVEIKGYKSDFVDKLREYDKPPESAHHQCNLYMALTGIHKGIIIIENKNTSTFKCWIVYYNEDMAKKYLDRIVQIGEDIELHLEHDILPERICDSKTCERAKTCNARDACFSKSRGLKLLPREEWDMKNENT